MAFGQVMTMIRFILTFELNENAEPNLTQILDLADTRGIKLNFFITNYFLKNYP